jgi:predicted deacylase
MRRKSAKHKDTKMLIANASQWIRAGQSGILRSLVASGSKVECGEVLAYINDPLGENSETMLSPIAGIVIGKTNLPLVFEGEAVFHIASYEETDHVSDHIEAYHELLDPLADDNETDEPPLM